MRANLSRSALLREVAAVAVSAGRVQLQRHTYTGRATTPTIESLGPLVPVEHVKPSLGMLMFHVRAANAYATEGNDANCVAAMKLAMSCIMGGKR